MEDVEEREIVFKLYCTRKNLVTKRRKTCVYVVQTYPHVCTGVHVHVDVLVYMECPGDHT